MLHDQCSSVLLYDIQSAKSLNSSDNKKLKVFAMLWAGFQQQIKIYNDKFRSKRVLFIVQINFSLKKISLEGRDEDGGYKIRLALVSSSANILSCTMLWGCNTQMLQKMKVHG